MEPGQTATAQIIGEAPNQTLSLGIPRGQPGQTGATPALEIGQVETLEPGEPATAELSGTTEKPVLSLGIPQGPPGQDGVQLNDDAINTTEAWSSKKIVDTLCPSFSVSGNPVTCNPVEDYPLSAVVSLEPKQAGTGDPSPDNIRPISGWENVRVETCGTNLLKLPYFTASGPSESYNGIDAQIDGDGRVSIHGTTTETGYNFIFQYENNFFLPSGTYYIDTFGAELPPEASVLVHNSTLGTIANRNKKTFTLNERIGLMVYINTSRNGVEFSVDKLGVVLCVQSAPTVFTPYQPGTTATLTLPETIYGGTVDAVTGVGSKTWDYIASYNGESLPGEWISDRDVYAPGTTPTTGAQVAYKLATPEPFQATGNQALPAVAGLNTVYTDGDSLTVTGRRDLVSALEDLQTTMTAVTTLISEGGLT